MSSRMRTAMIGRILYVIVLVSVHELWELPEHPALITRKAGDSGTFNV